MTRSHRFVHRLIWPLLTLAVTLGFALALILHVPPPA
jgi:hypothetical protein